MNVNPPARPCRCDNVRRGQPFDRGRDCPHCWQFHHLAPFNRAWGGDGQVVPVVAPPAPARGVGTHLKLILTSLGLDESASCSCESWRARMDAWGPAGCRANRAAIETHLRAEAGAVGWVAKLKAGAKAAAAGLLLNPLDPAPGLLDEAVRRAEAAPTAPAAVRAAASPRAALPPFPDRLTWVSTAQLVADSIALAGLAPADCSGVVGVPRSGMLPASVIAMHLHLPLGEIDAAGRVRWLHHGTRGGGGLLKPAPGPVLVVDDTVHAGGATRRARQQLAGVNAVYSAVYARPEAVGVLDLYARPLPSPHLLEWNYPNNGRVGGLVCEPAHYGHAAATDLDGVLIHDDLSGGPVGSLYLAPRLYPVKLIVTGRHERHRAATEADLRRVGVRFERLVMLPDHTPLATETAAAHKARHFKESRFGFFLESCPDQARLIFEAAKKPVICPRAGKVFQ